MPANLENCSYGTPGRGELVSTFTGVTIDQDYSSLVHTFPSSSDFPITAMVQSPAIDVIGIGHLDGTIRLFDIKQGELVVQLKVDDGSVTKLAFRLGERIIFRGVSWADHVADGPPILASASSSGSLASWDLSKGGRVIHVQRRAHEQAITGLEWVTGQPLLISSSGDNGLKVHHPKRSSPNSC